MTLLLAYLNIKLHLVFIHHKQVVNKGAHVSGECCYSDLSWGRRTAHILFMRDNDMAIIP